VEEEQEGEDLASGSGRWAGVLPKVMVGMGMGLLAVAAYPAVRVWKEMKIRNPKHEIRNKSE